MLGIFGGGALHNTQPMPLLVVLQEICVGSAL
jgi:hypothetical protein